MATVFEDSSDVAGAETIAAAAAVAEQIEVELMKEVRSFGGASPDHLQDLVRRFLDTRYPSRDIGATLMRLYIEWGYMQHPAMARIRVHVEGSATGTRPTTMEPQELAACLVILAMDIAGGSGSEAFGAAYELFKLWLDDAMMSTRPAQIGGSDA